MQGWAEKDSTRSQAMRPFHCTAPSNNHTAFVHGCGIPAQTATTILASCKSHNDVCASRCEARSRDASGADHLLEQPWECVVVGLVAFMARRATTRWHHLPILFLLYLCVDSCAAGGPLVSRTLLQAGATVPGIPDTKALILNTTAGNGTEKHKDTIAHVRTADGR